MNIHYKIRKLKWWVLGYASCYSHAPNRIAFCKRRPYHLGKHHNSRKTCFWENKLKLRHKCGNCRCGIYHHPWEF